MIGCGATTSSRPRMTVPFEPGDQALRGEAGEPGELGGRSLGSEQQERLAAVVQQGLDRAALTAARRQDAERDVIVRFTGAL
jgi:hypothetical protein